MEITTSSANDATVIKISGSIDGNTVNDAQQKIMPMLSAGQVSLVLDLKDCGYISSAGLRLLLMAAKQIAAQKGKMVLAGVSEEIKDVMEMTGFDSFFNMYDDVAAAVQAVGKGA